LGFDEHRLFTSSVNEAKEKGEQTKASPRSKLAHLPLKGGQNMIWKNQGDGTIRLPSFIFIGLTGVLFGSE